MRTITYSQALAEAQAEEMRRDPGIVLLGLEITTIGSIFGQTAGLYKEFGKDRVMDMPLSESGYNGMAIGMAMGGIRTIVETQFADFLAYSFDAIANQAAKYRYNMDGKESLPLVIRAPQGELMYAGPNHSQIAESWFMNVPGLKIVVPSNPYDAKGLLKTAIRDDDPVLFLEHAALCFTKGEVPEEEYTIPFGQAKVVKTGNDVTIIATQQMVYESIKAAEALQKEGINVEIIDPRTLVPLDKRTIFTSVKKTGRVVITHESPRRGGIGGEISAVITENCFHDLKAPILRVASANFPNPAGPQHNFLMPNKEDIIAAVKETLE